MSDAVAMSAMSSSCASPGGAAPVLGGLRVVMTAVEAREEVGSCAPGRRAATQVTVLNTASGTKYAFAPGAAGTISKAMYGSVRLAHVMATSASGSPFGLSTGQRVAVKVFSATALAARRSEAWLECPATEIEALSDLTGGAHSHTGIVQLYEVFASAHAVYAVMELLPEGDLFAYVSRHGPLPARVARGVVSQLVHAVAYMHARGVCHRDLSLENIVLAGGQPLGDAVPRVKVIDFGLSGRTCDGSLPPRVPCGKSFYMAPELLQSAAHTTKVDMWAVGCILWCLLTASPPWEAAAVVHANGDPFQRVVVDGDVAGALLERGVAPEPALVCLLRGLFELDPARRLSASEALSHAWLRGGDECEGDGRAADGGVEATTPAGGRAGSSASGSRDCRAERGNCGGYEAAVAPLPSAE